MTEETILKRTSEEWISDLRSSGSRYNAALEDLRRSVLKGLPAALSGWMAVDSPLYEALAEEVAQETLLKVLKHLDSFEGRSQFLTWVFKIASHTALSELRRRRWRDVSLENMLESEDGPVSPDLLADISENPEAQAVQSDLLERIQSIIQTELTQKQMLAINLIAIRGIPMDEVAHRMRMDRNAIYKLMHDARMHLKKRLEKESLNVGEILAVFEQR